MGHLQRVLSLLEPPTFVMIRNFVDDSEEQYPLDLERCSGELYAHGPERPRPPRPDYPDDPEKRELFHQRFGWKSRRLESGELVKEMPNYGFNTHPEYEYWLSSNQKNDLAIFGESYTTFWLCPSREDQFIDCMVEAIQAIAAQGGSIVYRFLGALNASFSDEGQGDRIDAYVLCEFWREYMQRTATLGPFRTMFETESSHPGVPGELERRLERLRNGPTDRDWDEMWDLLEK